MHKIGVIPFDIKHNDIALMFVTSQRRGRWIFPKGNLKEQESHKKGCKREAFEEAGIYGKILKNYPITTAVTKSDGGSFEQVAVTYYPMLVTQQIDHWPEGKIRQRHWALLKDVPRLIDEEDLLNLIHQFQAITPWIVKTANYKKGQLPE